MRELPTSWLTAPAPRRHTMTLFPPHIKYLVGVDEAGRGPLAGEVAVGAALAPVRFDFTPFAAIKDSKKLSPQKREQWLARMNDSLLLRYEVSFSSATTIDRFGITEAVRKALNRALRSFSIAPEETLVLLDGGLRAPREFSYQRTIIRGDETVPLIAMASIAAKVERDNRMLSISRRYPAYHFEEHKGYGTDLHMRLLRRFGPSPIHRKSFLPA